VTVVEAGDHYSLLITWDPDDRIFVVTVPELPGCRTHGRTREEAIRQAEDAIESWLEAARAEGAPIPMPRFLARAGRE
jgi:predicted RNase H-like HicB family nuclease